MKVQLSQSYPGQVISATTLNSNFNAFSGSLSGENFSTDCFETYHINKTTALSPTIYSSGVKKNGSFSTTNYTATDNSQAITHGEEALNFPAIVLPANSYLFVNWKQNILNWTTGSGDDPEDLQAYFFLTAEVNSAPSSSLVSGIYWTCSGYNIDQLVAVGNPVYELDTLPITMAGQVCYENATTSSQAIANLKLQIAPSYLVANAYTCSLGQGQLNYYILRK